MTDYGKLLSLYKLLRIRSLALCSPEAGEEKLFRPSTIKTDWKLGAVN